MSVSRQNHSKLQEHAYVSGELQLILLVLGCLDEHTGPHNNPSYKLLANEVPDLNLVLVGLLVLLDVDVDGEMGVDVAHLVLVALGDTDDQVVDEGADGAEGSDALARAVVELDLDEVLLGVREADSQVTEGLGESATGACRVKLSMLAQRKVGDCAPTLNDNVPGLDGDLDPRGDIKQFLGVAVAHLSVQFSTSSWLCDALCQGSLGLRPDFEFRENKNGAARRFDGADRVVNVHVLHLGGCCWLAMSTEVASEFGTKFQCVGRTASLTVFSACRASTTLVALAPFIGPTLEHQRHQISPSKLAYQERHLSAFKGMAIQFACKALCIRGGLTG
jgi:hypothetical protein